MSQRAWWQAGRQGPHTGDVHPAVLLAKLLPAQPGVPKLRRKSVEMLEAAEAAAIAVLQDLRHCYNEHFEGFSLTRFDGTQITI